MPNFIKIGPNFSVETEFTRIYKFGSESSIQSIIFIMTMYNLSWMSNFIKIGHTAILRLTLPKFLISGQDPQFRIPYFWLADSTCSKCQVSSIWIYFLFGTTLSWNAGINTCFNVKCLLLDRNFDFLGG